MTKTWRNHTKTQPERNLQETIAAIKDNETFLTTITKLRGKAYNIEEATVVVTTTRTKNRAIRLRAYNDTNETNGTNYFLYNKQSLIDAFRQEANTLTQPTNEDSTEYHQATTKKR